MQGVNAVVHLLWRQQRDGPTVAGHGTARENSMLRPARSHRTTHEREGLLRESGRTVLRNPGGAAARRSRRHGFRSARQSGAAVPAPRGCFAEPKWRRATAGPPI